MCVCVCVACHGPSYASANIYKNEFAYKQFLKKAEGSSPKVTGSPRRQGI